MLQINHTAGGRTEMINVQEESCHMVVLREGVDQYLGLIFELIINLTYNNCCLVIIKSIKLTILGQNFIFFIFRYGVGLI